MKINSTNSTNPIKRIISLSLSLILLTTFLFTLSAYASPIPSTTSNPITYEYYGIVDGNGHQSIIYLKVSDTWQAYTISSDYIGYSCMIITIDQLITLSTYKQLNIVNIKPITLTSEDILQANETIQAWNQTLTAE